mmetsp:Transcript_13427/g.34246  ORF Transcript_13427/g.34246 Transcript_13427/m.34246 type:complete len:287 (-) Transcript_13427:319-1179(-)
MRCHRDFAALCFTICPLRIVFHEFNTIFCSIRCCCTFTLFLNTSPFLSKQFHFVLEIGRHFCDSLFSKPTSKVVDIHIPARELSNLLTLFFSQIGRPLSLDAVKRLFTSFHLHRHIDDIVQLPTKTSLHPNQAFIQQFINQDGSKLMFHHVKEPMKILLGVDTKANLRVSKESTFRNCLSFTTVRVMKIKMRFHRKLGEKVRERNSTRNRITKHREPNTTWNHLVQPLDRIVQRSNCDVIGKDVTGLIKGSPHWIQLNCLRSIPMPRNVRRQVMIMRIVVQNTGDS